MSLTQLILSSFEKLLDTEIHKLLQTYLELYKIHNEVLRKSLWIKFRKYNYHTSYQRITS